MEHLEIVFFFFAVAVVYSSVGFGGGSSYLAIMALYAFPFKEMRLIALICNIIVVTGGTFIYIRHKQVDWKKIIPLVMASVPMAFAGAQWKLKQDTFFVILGCSLLVAGVLLWLKTKRGGEHDIKTAKYGLLRDLLLGAGIGFLSGLVGIGGGIFLSPVLNLTRWDTSKKIAAAASIFILVNSVSGIAGQLVSPPAGISVSRIFILAAAVLVGGQIGSRLGAVKFNLLVVKRITAIVVFYAGIEVLSKHLHMIH